MLGILLVRKPLGLTSHDVVNDVRRRFGTRRVGHAGTLDPLATGLLVVAVGPATRFLQYLPLEPKSYRATIEFGRATNTYDREGETTFEGTVPEDLGAAIREALPAFEGLIQQLPPMYSAVKVKGKPLYEYARLGKELERESRTVHIGRFEILEVDGVHARAHIECSGGTYIRTLAHDLGTAIGCGAHLSALERDAVGRFRLDQALTLDEAKPSDLIPLRDALPPMPLVTLDTDSVRAIREGRRIRAEVPEGASLVGLLEPNGQVFSVARAIGDRLQPECVIPAETSFDVV